MAKRQAVLFAALSLFFVGSAVAVASPVDLESMAAANAMIVRFIDSWNRADGAGFGENYWPEAEFVSPTGEIVNGRAAIVQQHVELWSGIFKGIRVTGATRRIQMLGSNYMIVDFDFQASGFLHPPPGTPVDANGVFRSHLKHILEKRNGVWKVRSAQSTFVASK